MSGPQGPVDPAVAAERPIDPDVRIGHVHLRTADIDRVRDFYVGDPRLRRRPRGARRPRVGNDRRHPLRLRRRLPPPPRVQHVEVGRRAAAARRRRRAASRRPELLLARELAEAVGRLVDAGVPLRQLSDHGTHLAVYLSDRTETTSSSPGTGRSTSGRDSARTTRRRSTLRSISTSCSRIAGDAGQRLLRSAASRYRVEARLGQCSGMSLGAKIRCRIEEERCNYRWKVRLPGQGRSRRG